MKTLVLTLGLLAACVRAGYAEEYITLLKDEQTSVPPTSLVQLVSSPVCYYNGSSDGFIQWTFDRPNGSGGTTISPAATVGLTMKGLVGIKNTSHLAATFKITHANELNVVAPTSLLVIPENSTGNYNIVVETSSDTATWTPFHSQTVSAADAKRFFRTRIVKAE
jgi:hypothetical protein